MKKILFAFIALGAMILASCSNEDIEITTQDPLVKDAVTVNVSLSNFYQSYDFEDTRSGLKVSDMYRSFHSTYDRYIQVRTLFYNRANGALQDSTVNYVTNINAVVTKCDLPEGDYYAITTVAFAEEEDPDYCYWTLVDKEDITTAYLDMFSSRTCWGILSESVETFTVKEGRQASVSTTPAPVGALCYMYMQNFQYKDEQTYYSTKEFSDNGVREIAIYTQQYAHGVNLDPNAISQIRYWDDAGRGFWYYIDYMRPENFNEDWGFFKANLYSFPYLLAPELDFCFGYEYEGENGFNEYGTAHYRLESGKTYIAYWDWFKVGEPYFGEADNDHWNNYDEENSNVREHNQMDFLFDFEGK